eukprot:TRINITY_DN9622_c0_g1_i1.p1 TRINITY_DN9622_c0_g1~~TRINITY_DN9622_c0_g1_i1.p1  ORF type:complete len:423 (-),score=101.40 TRINITY_DN9622_c0_g1_i1:141-1409(-)
MCIRDRYQRRVRGSLVFDMAGLASSFSTEVTLADTVMKPTVAHASWAVLDVIDMTTLTQYATILSITGALIFFYLFLSGPFGRKIEEIIGNRMSTPRCLAEPEIILFWPLVGLLMVLFMGNFAFTADTRRCFICAHGGVTVRGFNGFACSFEDDLKELLDQTSNQTTCIAAQESLLFPYSFAKTYPVPLLSSDQLTVKEQVRDWSLTGPRVTRIIQVTDDKGNNIPLMETDQPVDEEISAAHNETLRGLKLFADEDRDAVTVGIHASLGLGKGNVVIRTNAETVQMVVFKQHEQICAVLIAFGGVLLFGTALLEVVYFDKDEREVSLTRYYVIPFASKICDLSNVKDFCVNWRVRHWSEHLWFKKGTLSIVTINGFKIPLKMDYYGKELERSTCERIKEFLGESIGQQKTQAAAEDEGKKSR